MAWLLSQALMDRYGNLPCSQGQAEESSAGSCSAGAQSAPSNATPTQRAYLWRDKTTAFWNRFPSGMTCEHLTAERGEDVLTSYLADFPVRTSARRGKALASKASGQDSGRTWPASLAKYDHASRSWKTRQFSLAGDLIEFSETWPKWGLMRHGECFARRMPELATTAHECLFRHPTPCAMEHKGATANAMKKKGTSYFRYWLHHHFPAGSTTYPSQEVLESVMGWPIGWAGLAPLETARFHAWRLSHGES